MTNKNGFYVGQHSMAYGKNLEDARDIRNHIDGQGTFDKDVEVMDWLIEQSERVQELENKVISQAYLISDLKQQNKRYREAIDDAIYEYKIGNQDVDSGVMADTLMAALLENKALESELHHWSEFI